MVHNAVNKGLITEEEYEEIVGLANIKGLHM